MRFKPVPDPPADLEGAAPILEAVPATAGAVDDCCGRLVAETRLESRDAAETWLVFLRALELATEESAGYRRTAAEPSVEDALEFPDRRLREAFRKRVDGADAVLETLERADEPLTVSNIVDAVRNESPAFARATTVDRRGSTDRRRETARTERVRRLLEWAVLLEMVERAADGDRYRTTGALD